MHRRTFLGAAAAIVATPVLRPSAQPVIDDLLEEARAVAARPYTGGSPSLPAPFSDLSYDAYRGIRPIPGEAAMLPLEPGYAFDLLPPGLYFPDPVEIEVAGPESLNRIPFSPNLFSFDPRYFKTVPDSAPGAGFSGLRLRHALNAADRLDEFLVLQGASYFRAIGRSMVYGLSARAVALGTGGPAPEEFPRFTRLRLHRPEEGAARLEAVIDSPSLTGYLEMSIQPGAETKLEVTVILFPRAAIANIGLAPLTSMYLKGTLRAAVSDDFRPRVHDSDVLFIRNGAGEQLWRPIGNPARVETSAFVDDGPAAFGLFQTPRAFSDFDDGEARYHDRPSVVVTPREDWGPGAVTLVEIPTGDEFLDNIVVFWRPAAPLVPGQAYPYSYDLIWTIKPPDQGTPLTILQTRSGLQHDRPGALRYVIDFEGTTEGLLADLTARGGVSEISDTVISSPRPGITRASFILVPGSSDIVELRLVLRQASGDAASPVWLHRWTRARNGGI